MTPPALRSAEYAEMVIGCSCRYRSAARTYVKKAELAIRAGDQNNAATAVGDALSMLDRVASKGIIHQNNAARRKSRLMKKFNGMGAEA